MIVRVKIPTFEWTQETPPASVVAMYALLALVMVFELPVTVILLLLARGPGTSAHLSTEIALWLLLALVLAGPLLTMATGLRRRPGSRARVLGLLYAQLVVVPIGFMILAGVAGAPWLAPLAVVTLLMVVGAVVCAHRLSAAVFFGYWD